MCVFFKNPLLKRHSQGESIEQKLQQAYNMSIKKKELDYRNVCEERKHVHHLTKLLCVPSLTFLRPSLRLQHVCDMKQGL